MGDRKQQQKPFRSEMVRGEPYEVEERRLSPMARFTTYGRARATVGTKFIGGWGGGAALISPVAFVIEDAGSEQHIPVTDSTLRALSAMCGVTIAVTLFCATIRLLACSRQGGTR